MDDAAQQAPTLSESVRLAARRAQVITPAGASVEFPHAPNDNPLVRESVLRGLVNELKGQGIRLEEAVALLERLANDLTGTGQSAGPARGTRPGAPAPTLNALADQISETEIMLDRLGAAAEALIVAVG